MLYKTIKKCLCNYANYFVAGTQFLCFLMRSISLIPYLIPKPNQPSLLILYKLLYIYNNYDVKEYLLLSTGLYVNYWSCVMWIFLLQVWRTLCCSCLLPGWNSIFCTEGRQWRFAVQRSNFEGYAKLFRQTCEHYFHHTTLWNQHYTILI